MDASALARMLAALEDFEVRARKAAAVLSSLPAEQAVVLLGSLVRRSQKRLDPDAAALEGLLRGLRNHVEPATLEALHRAAEALGEDEVVALVTPAPASRSFDRDREQWVDREMRARTLGERKQLARTQDRDLLARLAQDQDPDVVRQLLLNPKCTEREALLAASRRPARSAVLEEVFGSRKWAQNRRVRRALAMNPYSPPALASAALALLTAPDLREVSADPTVSSEVRVQARRLLGQRGLRGA